MSGSFRTTVGLRGRVTVPPSIQDEAGIGVGDTVVVRAGGDGVIVIETPKAAKKRTGSEVSDDRKEEQGGSEDATEQ